MDWSLEAFMMAGMPVVSAQEQIGIVRIVCNGGNVFQ